MLGNLKQLIGLKLFLYGPKWFWPEPDNQFTITKTISKKLQSLDFLNCWTLRNRLKHRLYCYYALCAIIPPFYFCTTIQAQAQSSTLQHFVFLSSVFVFNMQPYLLTLFPYVFVECKNSKNMPMCRPFFRALKLFKRLLRVVLSVLCSS